MKIYQKKNASLEDETVLVQLERRHTVKEITDEVHTEDLRKTTRSNSLGIFEGGQSSTDVEASTTEKKSGFKRRPTVITESELASSTLYKDRKAKINSDDESIEDSTPPENNEDLEPRTLNDPKLKPVPVPSQRPRKTSSFCWYFAIILVIFIACLAVMAGVGGIVYMEYFATYSKVDLTDELEKNDKNPADSKGMLQHPLHKQKNLLLNEPKIPEHVLKDIIKNSGIVGSNTDVAREAPEVTSPAKSGVLRNEDLYDSDNSKEKVINEAKSSLVSLNQDIEKTEHPKTSELPDSFRDSDGRIRLFKAPIAVKSREITNIKNKDLLDLKLRFQSIDEIKDKIPEKHADTNKQITKDKNFIDVKSNSVKKVSDSNDGTSASLRTFNLGKIPTIQGFELKTKLVGKNIPIKNLPEENRIEHLIHPLPNDSSLDNIKKPIDNKQGDFFDQKKHSIDHSLEDSSLNLRLEDSSLNHSVEDSSLNHGHEDSSLNHGHEDSSLNHSLEDSSLNLSPEENSLDLAAHSIGHSHEANSLEHVENSNDNSFEDNSLEHVENSNDNSFEDNSLEHVENSDDNSFEDNSLDHAEHSIGQGLADNSFDPASHTIDHNFEDTSMEHFIDHSLEDNFLSDSEHSIGRSFEDTSLNREEHFIDQSLGSNSLDHTEPTIDPNLIDSSLNHTEQVIHHHNNNKSLDGNNEDASDFSSDDSSSEENSFAEDRNQDSDDSTQLVFIRPVVESKPVPVNVAFLKRMGIDIKNPNSHQPMTAEDMDIKFSLAEALKFLKSLDTDNKLPVSREKSVPQKPSKQVKSKGTKLPLITERNDYLNILRKKMFEQNS